MAKMTKKERDAVKNLLKNLIKADNSLTHSEIANKCKVSRQTFYSLTAELLRDEEISEAELGAHKGTRESASKKIDKRKRKIKDVIDKVDKKIRNLESQSKTIPENQAIRTLAKRTENVEVIKPQIFRKKQDDENLNERVQELIDSGALIRPDPTIISEKLINEGGEPEPDSDKITYTGQQYEVVDVMGGQVARKTNEIKKVTLSKLDAFADIDFRETLLEIVYLLRETVRAISQSGKIGTADIQAIVSLVNQVNRSVDTYTKTYALISIQQQHEMEKRVLFEVLSENMNQDQLTIILNEVSNRLMIERSKAVNPEGF